MDYSTYDIADFAVDEFFVSWVLHPSEESDAFWSEWLTSHPEMRKVVHEARLLVLLMESRRLSLPKRNKAKIWKNIQAQAFTGPANAPTPAVVKERKLSGYTLWLRIAACLLVGTTLSYVAVNRLYNPMPDAIVAENSRGKRSIIYLPDGTKVWLNAESRLTYPATFQDVNERQVSLVGEAFFDVTENPDKPFLVNTPNLQVKVLGTSFNVRSYETDNITETTLLRGKVMIALNSDDDDEQDDFVTLKENQQAVYSNDSGQLSLRTVEAEAVASWKEGKLVIVNKPIPDIEVALERWYGVEITIEGSVSDDCRFSTTIENEPITRILELFTATGNVTYTINDNLITLKGDLCP